MDRNEAIKRIRAALKKSTGRAWSVTGGRGTAWGWITVDAPPRRRTADHRGEDVGEPGHYMTMEDRKTLGGIMREMQSGIAHHQGVSIPASGAYRRYYVALAEGEEPTDTPTPYWD
jgi:hypothetical protein